jgi:formate hydrogenlyase transcriptional activator
MAENEIRQGPASINSEIKDRIIEWNLDWINVLDLEGRLLSMNFGGMKALEICEIEPLEKRPWVEFWDGQDEEAAHKALIAVRKGDIGRFTGHCATSSGESKWWDVVVSPIPGADGNTERILAVARDVTDLRRAQETLRSITEGTAAVTEGDFFRSLVRHVALALGFRYSFVAECIDDTKTRVRTLAFWNGEAIGDNVSYLLSGTPCAKVIDGGACSYPDHLQSLFPEDKDLATLKVESYLGVPLHGSSGDIVGHLVVMDDKPMANMQHHLPILHIFASRAGVELERKHASEALEKSEGRLRTLLGINNAIVSKLTRDELFQAISGAVGRVISFDRLSLSLHDPEADVLRLVTYAGPYRRDDYSPIGRVLELRDSPAGLAFLDQKPILRRDLEIERQTSSEERAFRHGFRSLCSIPLVVRGKSIGAITAGSLAKNRYSEADAGFLVEIANQVAIAVDNMKSYEEIAALNATITATAERRRTLLEINNAIISNLTRDALFRSIADALRRVVPFDRIAIFLHAAEKDVLRLFVLESALAVGRYFVGLEWAISDSHAGWVFKNRRPLLRHNLETNRHYPTEDLLLADGVRSLVVVPLIAAGRSIGTLNLNSAKPDRYSEADADFLQEVANQVALAIDNMKSYEEIEALKARFEAEAVYLQEEIKTEHNFEEIIGQSAPVRQLLHKIEQVAPTEATVLIRGETGTGKELLARAVHDRSRRKDRPLVKVNCGSIPSGLMESELFGHEKGAFTGATQRRIGRFELANGGTIFLDEVTELPSDTQVKLLRVLQEGEFERVGSSQTMKVDVRVIAATNRDLHGAVRSGTFRSDLFYRLNVFPLEVPSLRERREDIPLLVNFFLSKFGKKLGKEIRGVAQRGMESLKQYSWPGNIRELQNVVERAVIVASGPVVQIDESILRSEAAAQEVSVDTLENVERSHIVRALNETNWVIHGKKGAAEILGINPSTLRSRMEKLGIKRP